MKFIVKETVLFKCKELRYTTFIDSDMLYDVFQTIDYDKSSLDWTTGLVKRGL